VNTAGPVATIIFVITSLTVLAAIVSYAVFKARSRKPKKAGTAAGPALDFFVEYHLPGEPVPGEAAAAAAAPVRRGVIWAVTTLGLATVGMGGALVYVMLDKESTGAPPETPTGKVKVKKAGAGAAAKEAGKEAANEKEADEAPAPTPVDRGAPPDFSKLASRRPSLFVSGKMDLNRDARIQGRERALIHEKIPQFVVVTAEDSGSVEGMAFLRKVFKRFGLWGKVTYFFTANYLKGRKNYMGGPVDAWWQTILYENFGGLHGTTHDSGAEFWTRERWEEENSTAQDEITQRFRPPKDWRWETYPWGSRAPMLAFTPAYRTSLARLKIPALYDSSLVLHPRSRRSRRDKKAGGGEARDLPWPFTLDTSMPSGKEFFSPNWRPQGRGEGGRQKIWEVPAYAWYLQPVRSAAHWQPPIDYSLWAQHGCPSGAANREIVKDLIANLKAHYRGNRAPFLLGLHPEHYIKSEECHRATLSAILEEVNLLGEEGYNIRYTSIPDLILWMDWMSSR
jgi:hypothetical protein